MSAVLARLGRRARKARWQLAAGVAAVVIVLIAGHAPVWAGVAALLLVMLAALAGPPPAHASYGRHGNLGEAQLQALAAAELADAMPDPVITFDSQGVVAHANKSAQTAFGSIVGGMILQLRFRAPEMQDFIRQVVTTGEGRAVDYVERMPVERFTASPPPRSDSGTGLFVLVFKDQSEARRIDRMRADFIANASHELRTPLASISGFVETLRGPPATTRRRVSNFLQIMQSQTGRMARLIDDLLSLSRLEMKPICRPRAEVDLRQTSTSVIDSLGPLASESGVEIERRVRRGPVDVRRRPRRAVPGVREPLENACKYGQSGGRSRSCRSTPRCRTRSEERDHQAISGPGIARRAHSAHHRAVLPRRCRGQPRQKGTGLGLAIVKHILTRHKRGCRSSRKSARARLSRSSAARGSGQLGQRRPVSLFRHLG